MEIGDFLEAESGVLRTSPWLLVDQAMTVRFADATFDHQFIHVDPERARETAYGGIIAHGFLTLSLLPHLRDMMEDVPKITPKMRINYGFDRIRFLSPVRSGSHIRAAMKLAEWCALGSGMFDVVYECTIEIRDEDKPALAAIWKSRIVR